MTASHSIDDRFGALHARLQDTYERVARNPYSRYHFHRGPYYARRYLGYEEADLESLPAVALDRFTGVGNPFAIGEIHPGETVLDLGCGSGTDLLIAARRVGAQGRVIGVDVSPIMRRCARMAARAARLTERVEVREGRGEALPMDEGSVDVVIANAVMSFTVDRLAVFREIRRVLKPGGRLYLAELVLDRHPTFDGQGAEDLWAACIAGAMVEEELPELAARAGLGGGRLVGCYDCFRDAPATERFTENLKVHGVTFTAVK